MVHIQDVAVELFQKRGFAPTSVQDVAAAAEVSESSIYRYFGGKGGILVWEPLDAIFEEEFAARLGGLPVLKASEDAFVAAFSRLDSSQRKSLLARTRIAKNSPEAASAVMGQFQADVEELTEAFSKTLGIRRSNPRSALLARVVLECVDLALDRWQGNSKAVLGGTGRKSLPLLVADSFAALRDLPTL